MSYHIWEAIVRDYLGGVHPLRGEFEETGWTVPQDRALKAAEEMAYDRHFDPETVELTDLRTLKENEPPWWAWR